MADDKGERLVAIYHLMRQTAPLLHEANRLKTEGNLRDSESLTSRLVALLNRQLDETAEHDRRYPTTTLGTNDIVEQLLDALLTQADLLDGLRCRDEAESVRERALALSHAYQKAPDVAERRRQRAASLLAQARYHEAAVALSDARDEFARRNQPLETAHVAVDLAELYEWLGDFERAHQEASRTRGLIEPLLAGATPSFSDAFANLAVGRFDQAQAAAKLAAVWHDLAQLEGRLARNLGDFDAAESLFLKVRERTEHWVLPGIDFQIARTQVERGHLAQGLASIQALKSLMTGLLRPKLGVLLSLEAEALLRLGRPKDAMPIAREAAVELARYYDFDSLWKAQSRLGQALARTGHRPQALTAYIAAVDTVTNLRRFPMGYRLESTFFADKLPLFDDSIFLAADLADVPACFHLIEQVKSRALTSMLTVAAVAAKSGSDHDLAVDELSRQVDALEYQAYRNGWNDETTSLREQLLTERTRLLERIRLADPRWRTLTRSAEAGLDQVAASLAHANQAALSLYYRSGRVVALLIHRGAARVAVGTLAVETAAAVEAYHRNLESPSPDHHAFDPATCPELAAERLVPAEFLEEALDADGLVIVPHGSLHLLPWPALTCNGRRLFERCAVGVLPNLTCLVILDPVPAGQPSIALVGAPSYQGLAGLAELPLAAEEVFTVADIFGDRVIGTWIGSAATQEAYHNALAALAGVRGILHLACHGDMVAGDPENSGLLLSDGRLDAADIARKRIAFDEVVLSSCASGYRPTRVGSLTLTADDIVGVPGAFLEAGARSVLVSIPPARDDAAFAFMTLYYEHRVQGQAPLRALREAQLVMLHARDYPVHLWAGFVLYGH